MNRVAMHVQSPFFRTSSITKYIAFFNSSGAREGLKCSNRSEKFEKDYLITVGNNSLLQI